MSFRKEKKFRVTFSEFNSIRSLIKAKGAGLLYGSRLINSVYFDTFDLRCFSDSEEGLLPRKKIRVRWYNQDTEFFLEKKISSTEGRFKTTNPLIKIRDEKGALEQKLYDQQYGVLTPSMKVSYLRSYFEFKKIRITFDENIAYQELRRKSGMKFKDPEQVVELKVHMHFPDDVLEQYFPYPTSRFSKYSRGLLFAFDELRRN